MTFSLIDDVEILCNLFYSTTNYSFVFSFNRAKQLIKDAVMENDFLKNLDASQVREIVESMYPREFEKGSFVIREGDAGKCRLICP